MSILGSLLITSLFDSIIYIFLFLLAEVKPTNLFYIIRHGRFGNLKKNENIRIR